MYLHKYLYHENLKVRQAVASNKNIFLSDLEKLTEDICDEVIISALSNSKMSEKIISKIINEPNYLSGKIILALLTSKKMSKHLYDELYSKHIIFLGTRILYVPVIKSENISEDVFEYFITDHIKECKIPDTNIILKSTILLHENFEKVIKKLLMNITNVNLFIEDDYYISKLSENNLKILWDRYLKLENELDDARKLYFFDRVISSKYINYDMIEHILDSSFKMDSYIFEIHVINIVKNNNIQSDSIELLWRKINSLKGGKDISKHLKEALILNANTQKKLVSYLNNA